MNLQDNKLVLNDVNDVTMTLLAKAIGSILLEPLTKIFDSLIQRIEHKFDNFAENVETKLFDLEKSHSVLAKENSDLKARIYNLEQTTNKLKSKIIREEEAKNFKVTFN